MAFEAGKYSEQEKKNKKTREEESKHHEKQRLQQEKTKEYIQTEIETEALLAQLHDLVDKGLISHQTVEHIVKGEHLKEEEIQDIFEKIDQIENVKDIDTYLPKELRISKDEYSKAINDDILREEIITKLNTSLTILSQQITPDSVTGINIFSGFLTLLDKNLIKIQENTIDIKSHLQDIHNKNIPKETLSYWEKIKKLLLEIFSNK